MNKLIALSIGVLCAGGIWWYFKRNNTPKDPNAAQTLIVGTSADYKPFSFKENGEIVGFDIDVVKAVAQKLGASLTIKDMPFELLLPQLQLGTVQLVAAGLTPTPERAQRIAFSPIYLDNDPLIVVTRKNTPTIKSVEDLNGKTVIVNQGYTADRYMSALKGPMLTRLPDVSNAVLALRSERADAFVAAKNSVRPFFEQYGEKEFNTFTIPDTEEKVALAITPAYPDFVKRVEKAVNELIEEGVIQQLKEKWHLS
jgi:ABC-type amino acid transport substrate-binding protein